MHQPNPNINDPFNSPWVQYQQLRLARLQQQRQRMESMKQVIEKYSLIISDMEAKNKELLRDNQEVRRICDRVELENQEIRQKNQELVKELSQEMMMRSHLENTVRQLKEDISILTVGVQNRQETDFLRFRQPIIQAEQLGMLNNFNYQVEYQTLQQLYEGMKKQFYLLSKQNLELKSVIKEQSKQFHYHRSQQSRENIGKILTVPNIPLSSNGIKINENQRSHQGTHNPKELIKQLKLQIKKQEMLIDKFKKTEEQQQELIELLKNNKSKVCACHTNGVKSSKKIISIKNIDGEAQA